MNNEKTVDILLTCGPKLCEVNDFLDCYKIGITEFRIHLGKTDRDNFKIIKNLMTTESIINYPFGIYIDLPTTRPRMGKNLTNINKTNVEKGDHFNIIFKKNYMWTNHMEDFDNNVYITNFEKYKRKIQIGNRIMLKDGSYSGIVTNINDYGIEVQCENNVKLYESESLLFPEISMEYEVFDYNTICFLEQIKESGLKINKFIISFCHSKKTIEYVRRYLKCFLNSNIKIMAKIEDIYGVEKIDEIVSSADSIMIGRGDLAASVGFDNLPKIQERIVTKAKVSGKPVYVATQFLEELAQNNHLCSPEINDIFLAISQGANGIMLSGEAGASPHSVKCIQTLYEIIKHYNTLEENQMNKNKHTKILATMGPTLQSVEDASKMIELGVCQFRIHMGLRTRDFCSYFKNAIIASEQLKKDISVLLDLPSSRPRVVDMDEYTYSEGEFAYIYDRAAENMIEKNYVNIPLPNFTELIKHLNVGERVMFRDGHIVFIVKQKFQTSILAQCVKSDLCVKTGASSCFPDSTIVFTPIETIDVLYLKKMKKEGLHPQRVAVSFASTSEQIKGVRKVLKEIWPNEQIEIISKIESKLGLTNIDELIECSDGIMIARGDLLLSINPYEMPRIQFQLAEKCTKANKILIIATEFFERFSETGIVNRAELSDVALAVRQNADAIMLARETGNSQYSVECVKIISSIICKEYE